MRLRYFHMQDLPPLEDLAVTFQRPPSLPDRTLDCTIHFVVGVNGVGKSRFLQNLTHVLLSLERQERTRFPATLAYDLGTGDQARTIYLHFPQNKGEMSQSDKPDVGEPVVVEFTGEVRFSTFAEESAYWVSLAEVDWEKILAVRTDLPPGMRNVYRGLRSMGSGTVPDLLPFLLTYTSGAARGWDQIFAPRLLEADTLLSQLTEIEANEEWPLDWNVKQGLEAVLHSAQYDEYTLQSLLNFPDGTNAPDLYQSRIGTFVGTEELPLAVCAVVLHQAAHELAGEDRREFSSEQIYINRIKAAQTAEDPESVMGGLRGVLNEIGWLWPVTIRMEMTETPNFDRERAQFWHRAVTQVLRRPGQEDTGKSFVFDVNTFPENGTSTAEALAKALGGSDGTAFTIFRQLLAWKRSGTLRDLSMTFQRLEEKDLLLYDWLSDGERMLLGRVALFYLLKGSGTQDALLILDEPETHFNDIWKRQIVDMLVESLGSTATDVLVSTHSSIELSDLFAEQIERLRKRDGKTVADQIVTPTFGTDPSEIMIRIFDAPDSIGKQALEYLEHLVQRDWQPEEKTRLEELIRQVGAGYHRSELRSIWQELNATPR